MSSPFRIAVINDEIGQDFDRACEVISREFGLEWIELRGMWNKNLLHLDSNEVAEARRILEKYKLRVTDIASPLFKVDWPGAPKSQFSPKGDQFHADFTYEQQAEVLERSIELAKAFQTDRVRCFDFWRLEDQTPFRAAMNEKLLSAANVAGKKSVTLVLENEPACNTATAAEAAKVLAALKSPSLMLNWGSGQRGFPRRKGVSRWVRFAAERADWPLPLQRRDEETRRERLFVGSDGPRHHRLDRTVCGVEARRVPLRRQSRNPLGGAGTPEESSRQSWAGMKELLRKAWAL